jgi:predicted permease
VRSASLSSELPLGGGGFSLGAVLLPGAQTEADGADADWSVVSPGYFETLQIPIVRGRGIQASDRRPAGAGATTLPRPPVATVVNETAAARLWPDREPLGQRFHNGLGPASLEFEVVGIARNAKYRSLGEAPRLFVYVPHAQVYMPRMHLLLRRDAGPSLLPAARTLVRDLEPNLPVIEAQSLEEFISLGLLPHRVALNVAATLGAVGVLLACIGIYGVTAYSASQRTREIGIRMALGARRGDVLRLIARQSVLLAAAGIGLGAALAFGAANLLRALLYGVSPTDPLTFLAATGLFVVVSLAACLIPARNAAGVNPVSALRSAD